MDGQLTSVLSRGHRLRDVGSLGQQRANDGWVVSVMRLRIGPQWRLFPEINVDVYSNTGQAPRESVTTRLLLSQTQRQVQRTADTRTVSG